jgi:uncharacterized membrane protein
MSLVVVIVVVIVLLLFFLIYLLGYFTGLGRKKKELARLEEENKLQHQRQETIISRFLDKEKDQAKHDDENDDAILPIKLINRGYRRIKKFLRLKQRIRELKDIDIIWYLRKYLLSYVGIIVLILGFGFYIKFAVTAELIPVEGRFIISVFVSILLVVIAHFIRKQYKTFSAILMGGAMGSLYLTFALSFYLYNIFSNLQIFGIYLMLTAFTVILSIFYNRFELLFLAVIAAFVGPVFSSFDFRESHTLLIYLLMLNIGSVFIAARYRLFILRLIPAVATGAYMILWMRFCLVNNYYSGFQIDFFLFTLLYIVLVILAVTHNVWKKTDYMPYELMMVLIINLIYYSIGMYMLNELNPGYKGVFTLITALFNVLFLILILLFRKDSATQLIYFFSITALLFLTLIPPVELVGKSITMIWAVETVLLMWVALRLNITILRLVSTFLMLGLIASFVLDVIDNYMLISINAPDKTIFINKSFISGIMTSFGLGLNALIINRSNEEYLIKPIKFNHLKTFISIAAGISLYVSLYTELLYQLTLRVPEDSLVSMYLGIFNFAFIFTGVLILTFIKGKTVKYITAGLAVFAFILFYSYYLFKIVSVREYMLNFITVSMGQFLSHLILITLITAIILLAYMNIKKLKGSIKQIAKWFVCILIMAVLITEIDHIIVIRNHGSGIPVSSVIYDAHRFYYTMFWAASALLFSLTALLFADKELVRISIFVIFASLVKLFFDMPDLSTEEKTISFISLGVIILIIAFVRQRLFESYNSEKPQGIQV